MIGKSAQIFGGGRITAKFESSGQTYVCANRICIQQGTHDRLVESLVEAVGKFKFGAAHDLANTHRPLITPVAVEKITSLVDDARQLGAKC